MNLLTKLKRAVPVIVLSTVTLTGASALGNNNFSIRPTLNVSVGYMYNGGDRTKSAPGPVVFNAAAGASIQFTDLINFEPTLKFNYMYYLWDDNMALPAETEQRTATVLAFMLDLPVGFTFRVKKHTFMPGIGLGFNMRFAMLAPGVNADSPGNSGTAADDVKNITNYFWQYARFLYPKIFFSWDYETSNGVRVGAITNFYLPLGSLCSGKGMDGFMIDLGARLVF